MLATKRFQILLHFNHRKYAFIADFKQSFLQVEVAEEIAIFLEQLGLLTLSRHNHLSLTFASCDSLAVFLASHHRHSISLLLLGTIYRNKTQQNLDEILRSIYVDDFLTGADKVQQALTTNLWS